MPKPIDDLLGLMRSTLDGAEVTFPSISMADARARIVDAIATG